MRIYRLIDPDTATYWIQAGRKWHLPGVRCEFCDAVWTSLGLDYPSLDLSSYPQEASYRAGVVSGAEYKLLRQALLDWLSRPLVVRPGTGFGPLIGRADGAIRGLAWVKGWTLLLPEETLRVVASQARGVRGQPTFLTGGRRDYGQLIELYLDPCAELHPSVIPFDLAPPCEECGRWALKMPEEIVLKASSIPDDTDVFRGIDLTTAIFATERFLEALRSSGTTDFAFEEVKVAPS